MTCDWFNVTLPRPSELATSQLIQTTGLLNEKRVVVAHADVKRCGLGAGGESRGRAAEMLGPPPGKGVGGGRGHKNYGNDAIVSASDIKRFRVTRFKVTDDLFYNRYVPWL